jgi:hypothetical protein
MHGRVRPKAAPICIDTFQAGPEASFDARP